jgi:hypothetical protein
VTFAQLYDAKFPKAVKKITNDQDELLAFFDFPAEHWIHPRTTNPIESTFSTVRLRTNLTRGTSAKVEYPAALIVHDICGLAPPLGCLPNRQAIPLTAKCGCRTRFYVANLQIEL